VTGPLWELLSPPSEFARPGRTALRAEGVRVQHDDGRWRLCATSGLWNANLGYGNKAIADAVHAALLDASFLGLFRSGHRPARDAADALLAVAGRDRYARVIFSTSGSAANDLMMKLCRQHWMLRRQFRRNLIVGLTGSYHGLTYGSFGLTGEQLGQSLYGVDRRHVRHVDFRAPGQLADLLAAEGDAVAALVLEPVLGTGAYALPAEFLSAVQELRDRYGFLLVADEVATGFGRTGSFFASDRWPVPPDVLVASKGLTNGTCAASVVLAAPAVCAPFDRADAVFTHAETQAGTPPTCAAILATLAEMNRLDAVPAGRELGRRLGRMLTGYLGHPLVAGLDGQGCFRSVRLAAGGDPLPPAAVAEVVAAVREAGALVQAGPGCVQIVPPLVYDEDDLGELDRCLRAGLDRVAARSAAVPS
jgi:adenosylmethionine-8-amino-7-oxononanoate aminotransferase